MDEGVRGTRDSGGFQEARPLHWGRPGVGFRGLGGSDNGAGKFTAGFAQ